MNLILSKKGIIPKAQFIFPSKFDFSNVHEFFWGGGGGLFITWLIKFLNEEVVPVNIY